MTFDIFPDSIELRNRSCMQGLHFGVSRNFQYKKSLLVKGKRQAFPGHGAYSCCDTCAENSVMMGLILEKEYKRRRN